MNIADHQGVPREYFHPAKLAEMNGIEWILLKAKSERVEELLKLVGFAGSKKAEEMEALGVSLRFKRPKKHLMVETFVDHRSGDRTRVLFCACCGWSLEALIRTKK